MGASLRFFFGFGPRGAKSAKGWWPDVSWLYLRSLDESGLAVRALPIGGAYVSVPRNDPTWRHWLKIQHMFTAELEQDYVNVVCSTPGRMLGRKQTRGEMSPAHMDELDHMATGHPGAGAAAVHREMTAGAEDRDPDEVLYDPSTALSSLWTEGRTNIAITGVNPVPPDRDEVWALDRYDKIVSPTASGAKALGELGLSAMWVRPDTFPRMLRGILDGDSTS